MSAVSVQSILYNDRVSIECTPLHPLFIQLQELELLGENAVPQALYTPGNQEQTETAEAGTQAWGEDADTSSGVETKAVELDSLGLEPEKKQEVEAVPAERDGNI